MRLLIVGGLSGQISAAAKIAIDRGAKVAIASDRAEALGALRRGEGADLIMIDVRLDVAAFIDAHLLMLEDAAFTLRIGNDHGTVVVTGGGRNR